MEQNKQIKLPLIFIITIGAMFLSLLLGNVNVSVQIIQIVFYIPLFLIATKIFMTKEERRKEELYLLNIIAIPIVIILLGNNLLSLIPTLIGFVCLVIIGSNLNLGIKIKDHYLRQVISVLFFIGGIMAFTNKSYLDVIALFSLSLFWFSYFNQNKNEKINLVTFDKTYQYYLLKVMILSLMIIVFNYFVLRAIAPNDFSLVAISLLYNEEAILLIIFYLLVMSLPLIGRSANIILLTITYIIFLLVGLIGFRIATISSIYIVFHSILYIIELYLTIVYNKSLKQLSEIVI